MGAIPGDMSSHHQAALEGSMSADNMARQSQNFEVGVPDGIPGTSTPYGQVPTRQVSGIPNVTAGGAMSQANLPGVVSDENVYRLYDLVNSDFRMPVTDKDFELSHE